MPGFLRPLRTGERRRPRLIPIVSDNVLRLPLGERLWGSLFQSVTARTAGFNTLDLSRMSEAGQGIMALLMLTGGAPAPPREG